MAMDYCLTSTGKWIWTTASQLPANGYGLLPHSHRQIAMDYFLPHSDRQMAMDYCLRATGR